MNPKDVTVTRRVATRDFQIKDCALTAIATGRRAQNLRELRDNLLTVHPGSIYYHFWGGLLRPSFVEPEYNNDFAAWAHRGLHDSVLTERLAVIDPTDFENLEKLRMELIEVIEERLDEIEIVPWSRPDQQFHFIRSQIVVIDTHHTITEPSELVTILPHLSISSVFYHFIDARRRTDGGTDDFRAWLLGFKEDHGDLSRRLAEIDPYFSSLTELREQLSAIFNGYFHGKG
jgi:hypothetical protein